MIELKDKISKHSLIRVLESVLVFLLVIQGNTLYVYLTSNQGMIISILFILFLLILNRKGRKLNNRIFVLLCSYSVVMIIGYSLINISSPSVLMMSIAFGIIVIYFENKNEIILFWKLYCNIIELIAFVSLFFFLFGTLLSLIKPTNYYSSSQIGWGSNTYYSYFSLFYSGANAAEVNGGLLGYKGVPNSGIFTEPPMYAYFLVLALYVEMIYFKNTKKIKIVLLVITCLTTFSTNALIGIILCFTIYVYIYSKAFNNWKVFLLPVVGTVTVYAIYFILSAKSKNKAMAYNVRLDDLLACAKCFVKHPVSGVGFENGLALSQYRLIPRKNAASSSGFLSILAYGGLMWGIWYIIPFVLAVKNIILKKSKEIKAESGLIILSFILLVNISIQNRMISFVVCAFSWIYIINTIDTEKYLNYNCCGKLREKK